MIPCDVCMYLNLYSSLIFHFILKLIIKALTLINTFKLPIIILHTCIYLIRCIVHVPKRRYTYQDLLLCIKNFILIVMRISVVLYSVHIHNVLKIMM